MASVEQYPYKQGSKAAEVLLDLISREGKKETPESYVNFVINGQLIVHSGRR